MTESKWGLATGEVWDAVETRERILDGSVSAKEVLEAAIARAEAAEPLGAIVAETFERARKTIAKKKDGALFGAPTFIKDLAQVEGVATGWGSRGSAGYVSRRSDTITKRIEETGLVTLGKSACPELGLNATTEPLGSAPCRNPWDPSRSSGGSSGGAAALVAAGVVPIAHATDGGGSIRIPASCCGTPDRVIQRRMGHASASTTDRYIKAAESLHPDAIGVPFPALPKALWTRVWTRNAKTPAVRRGLSVARVGFELDPTSASIVAESSGNDADPATRDDAKRLEVSASVDDAIRVAIKLAIDVDDLRARALFDLLDAKPKPATVTPLVVLSDHKR